MRGNMKQQDDVCSTREAADLLGVSLKTIQLWVDAGVLDAWKTVGGHRRVSLKSVRRAKQERAQSASSAPDSPRKPEVMFACQPILTGAQDVLGYEVLYRDGEQGHRDDDNPMATTTRVISLAFGELGILSAMGDSTCFIRVVAEMLFEDMLLSLPADRVVLQISAQTEPSDEIVERCRQLRELGYVFLLDDYRPGQGAGRLLPEVRFVKVDYRDIDASSGAPVIALPPHVELIAAHLATEEAFLLARETGARYFQGFFFANPRIVWGVKMTPQRTAILSLLAMIIGDAHLDEIEQRLKLEPAICFSLLRLANSPALRVGKRIEGLKEALILLGRKNLQRWFQVLLFSHEEDAADSPNALMLSAAFRGRLLEYLSMLLPQGKVSPEKAFMVGIFSFVEALLHMPIYEVLLGLPLSEDVESALLYREGPLGALLKMVEALDQGQFDEARAGADHLNLAQDKLQGGLIESMHFCSMLSKT